MAQVTIAEVGLYPGEVTDNIKMPVSVGDGNDYTLSVGQIKEKVKSEFPDISGKADKADVYTKGEIDTKVSNINSDLNKKANAVDVYTKGETDSAINTAKEAVMGVVDTKVGNDTYNAKISEIEASIEAASEGAGEAIGDVDGKVDTHIGDNVRHITADERTAWNAKTTMTEVESKGYDTVTSVNQKVAVKANSSDVYTKNEIDGKVSEINNSINTKADAASVYTKGEIDGKVSDINGSINTKANQTDFTAHTGNTTVHITAAERTAWNGKTTMAEVEAKDYATHTELTEVENKIPTNTEVWTFTTVTGEVITRTVYIV